MPSDYIDLRYLLISITNQIIYQHLHYHQKHRFGEKLRKFTVERIIVSFFHIKYRGKKKCKKLNKAVISFIFPTHWAYLCI